MFRQSQTFLAGLSLLLIFNACISQKPRSSVSDSGPKAPAEFRAAWVATVANIDWPSKPGLSTEKQKEEAIALLDFLKLNNFNAVVFQVRPQADAMYKSDLEPWSYYLNAEVGKAPSPYYDPLEFWVEAAHERGLELHVWLNPYRSHHKSAGPVSEKSLVKTNPGLSVYLKEGYWWMDPAKKETQDHTTAVVMDIVKRYDIDGVHFDDYFYPYPSYNHNEDFPDDESWKAYQVKGGKLSRSDWRRESVNNLIQRLYKEIKAEKKYVKFGLSPFGIWRPEFPESIAGFDQHEQLYADARLWLNKGWIDYFAPQLYWEINKIPQSFPVLLGWWAGENLKERHLWPGISVNKGGGDKNNDEIVNEIMISRGILPKSKGIIHWNISQLVKNPGLTGAILNGPYKKPALVPASPWLDNVAPESPLVSIQNDADRIKLLRNPASERDIFRWVVYYQYADRWDYQILNSKDSSFELALHLEEPITTGQQPAGTVQKTVQLKRILVSGVDRTGNESAKKEVYPMK
jgi:uncharacterized lipoprotein YddW (UPF0748 family)